MANNSVTALNTAVGNGAEGGSSAAGNDAMANLATGNASGSSGDRAGEWVAEFCKDYGEAMLLAGQIFLYVGLGLAIAVAAIEIYVAFKTASKQTSEREGDANKVRGLTSLPAVIEALKSLLTALSSAKIWLALTILGLLLLWMAATAPWTCGEGCEGNMSVSQANTADDARQNNAGETANQSANTNKQ